MGEDLQTLVRCRLDDLFLTKKFTAAKAVRRAAQAGHKITAPRLSQIAAMPTGERWRRPAGRETIFAIACGLDLHVARVADAALRSTGIPMPVRRYGRPASRATIREVCAECAAQSCDIHQLVVMLPHLHLTDGQTAELVQAVEDVVARQLATFSEEDYPRESFGA